jgi:hypothetical protein
MRTPSRPTAGRDGVAGPLVLGATAVALGFVGALPFPLGPVLGALGVAASAVLRGVPSPTWNVWALAPAILAIAVEALTAAYSPVTVLLSGACGVAFLFWIADDAALPAGNGRRGLVPISIVAGALGLAIALVLVLPRGRGRGGSARARAGAARDPSCADPLGSGPRLDAGLTGAGSQRRCGPDRWRVERLRRRPASGG